MTITVADTERLHEIGERSEEIWRVHNLPEFDPKTGAPRPLVLISQSDEDVKFLLEQYDAAQMEIERLEELFDADEVRAEQSNGNGVVEFVAGRD